MTCGDVQPEELRIVPFQASMAAGCARILGELPQWFGIPDANEEYVRSLPGLATFVALLGGSEVGFIALERTSPDSVENHVLAVHPRLRRRGVGKALLRHAEAWCLRQGASFVFVKTLAPSDPYAPYAETRAFYAALGYRPLFESTAFWGEGNPAVVMVKPLSAGGADRARRPDAELGEVDSTGD